MKKLLQIIPILILVSTSFSQVRGRDWREPINPDGAGPSVHLTGYSLTGSLTATSMGSGFVKYAGTIEPFFGASATLKIPIDRQNTLQFFYSYEIQGFILDAPGVQHSFRQRLHRVGGTLSFYFQ
jgi:hypothetical protein